MEVYDLALDKDLQLKEDRAYHAPQRNAPITTGAHLRRSERIRARKCLAALG